MNVSSFSSNHHVSSKFGSKAKVKAIQSVYSRNSADANLQSDLSMCPPFLRISQVYRNTLYFV